MIGVGVDQLVGVLTRLESRAIRVYPRQCSKLRHRRSTCALCADTCPVQAIAIGEALQVDPEKCTGCGICATVCPTGAFEARDPTNVEMFARIKDRAQGRNWVALACVRYLESRGEEANSFVQVPCLGRLDESILVGAASVGIQTLWLMDDACQECPQAIGRAIAEQVAQRSNAWLQALGIPQRIAIGPQLPSELRVRAQLPVAPKGPSRRAFLSVLARETARTAAVTMESIRGDQGAAAIEAQVPKKGELPVRLPAKRQLLLAALGCLGRPAVASSEIRAGLFAQLGFKETCTGCQMCAFFCPTGALTKAEEDGKVGVAFRAAHCVNCGLCRDICYREAIVLSENVNLSTIMDDVTEVILMRDAGAVPGLASPKERTKKLLESIYPRNE
jgi:ferredoxin